VFFGQTGTLYLYGSPAYTASLTTQSERSTYRPCARCCGTEDRSAQMLRMTVIAGGASRQRVLRSKRVLVDRFDGAAGR
jgi:hypothetical protein